MCSALLTDPRGGVEHSMATHDHGEDFHFEAKESTGIVKHGVPIS